MTLNIWRVTDGKSGHDSQSAGLCKAIADLSSSTQFDLTANSLTSCLKSFISQKFPDGNRLPDPDIIIGAGHGTHLTMLSAKRVRKGKIVVIMKPSLPLNFFDICVIPKHDAPPKKKNVIETNGALNTLEFNNNKSKNLGLILIGGPSKHYEWNNKLIISQIDAVVSRRKEMNWTISDSPRTPKNMMSKILASNYKNVDILDFNNNPNKNIKKLIFLAKDIWISPDSISMIYESLTSGASVGLFEMLKKRKSRIYTSVDNLIIENHVTTFSTWEKTNALQTNNLNLSESKRCASIILERLL